MPCTREFAYVGLRSQYVELYRGWSDATEILWAMGQHGVPCEVKWWRVVALFQ